MARKPFVVIDAEMLSSSVWSEAAHVRLVWITLLILCDTDGYVGAAIPGIASAAGVTLEQAEEAISRFQEPDPYSRTQVNEGRRVALAERGFQILNFREHLDRLSAEKAKSRERVRRHRARQTKKRDETPVTPGNGVCNAGRRDQGPETREGREEGSPLGTTTDPPPTIPPTQRAEEAVVKNVDTLQLRLGALLAQLAEHPNSRLMLPAWSAKVTAYRKGDRDVGGRQDFRMIRSPERLEKSISDAEWWLEQLEGGKVVGSR